MINTDVWLIGAGSMSVDYAKVLQAQEIKFDVIGRGEKSAAKFRKETGIVVHIGGLESFIIQNPLMPRYAIVAVGVGQLAGVTRTLIEQGVKNILVEKPAGFNSLEIEELFLLSSCRGAEIFVAYNRRFYASTIKAQEFICNDGGVLSFNFEFTEWPHVIEIADIDTKVKNAWVLANSSHVIDLAFFLGGIPKDISSYTNGGLPWHPRASAFVGAGNTKLGALFSYQANWLAPGRWGVEIMTPNTRLIFRPIEELHIQKHRSVAITKVKLDDDYDIRFKPGLYRQVEAFFDGKHPSLLKIVDHLNIVKSFYNPMSGM